MTVLDPLPFACKLSTRVEQQWKTHCGPLVQVSVNHAK